MFHKKGTSPKSAQVKKTTIFFKQEENNPKLVETEFFSKTDPSDDRI